MKINEILTEQQGVTEGLDEMDKSAPQPGRDGQVSHSTYGSRDKKGSDYFTGKESPGKPVTKKQMARDALDILKKSGVAETSDYSRRREREEAIISGKKPTRKKAPAQTSDYARRREQEKKAGVVEAVDTNNLTNVAHALGKLKGREVFVRIGDPRLPLSDKTEFKSGVIFDREPVYGVQPGTGPGGSSNFIYWMKDETGRDFSAPSRDVFVAKQDVAEGRKR